MMQREIRSELLAGVNPNVSIAYPSIDIRVPFLQNSQVRSLLTALKVDGQSANPSIYLHFENVRGKGNFPIVEVYLDTVDANKLTDENHVGSLGFYGLQESSTPSLTHNGTGMHLTLKISEPFARLMSRSDLPLSELKISLIPTRKIDRGEELIVGRITIIYQQMV